MIKENKKVLILTGDGINCESETAYAFNKVGFETEIKHLNDVMEQKITQNQLVEKYKVVALPGGFSFGDHLSSGNVLSLKIKNGLGWNFNEYAKQGGLVLGICNGFQALIRLGVFGENVSITHNDSGEFINRWVKVSVSGDSPWLKGIDALDLPVRHAEGKVVFDQSSSDALSVGLRYQINPNGSYDSIAGLCDQTGRILGLMPHPEAFIRSNSHPQFKHNSKLGLSIFQNAFEECL